MFTHDWRQKAARTSLKRLLPRLEKSYENKLAEIPVEWNNFKNRLNREWKRLFANLHELYGWQFDFYYTLELVIDMLIRYWLDRPTALHQLDEKREANRRWTPKIGPPEG